MIVPMLLLIQAVAAPPPPPEKPSERPLAALAMTPLRARVTGVARPNPTQVRLAVDAEWSHYDTRHHGRLSPLEFGRWVLAANGAKTAITPVATMNATARAFARADANHDGAVTPEEMTTFLMR